MDHLAFSCCLSVNFNSEQAGSYHLPFIYLNCLIPVYKYSNKNSHSHGKLLCQLEYTAYTVSSAFNLRVH